MNVLLACSRSKSIGLGHFSRMAALNDTISTNKNINSFLSILGDDIGNHLQDSLQISIISASIEHYFSLVKDFISLKKINLVTMDFHKSVEGIYIEEFFRWSRDNKIKLIGVDSLFNYRNYLDHIWLPSIYFDLSKMPNQNGLCDITFGWDHFLLSKNKAQTPSPNSNQILIMTGGSDVLGLGEWLPQSLDNSICSSFEIVWVQGPYAAAPSIPEKSKLKWNVFKNPKNMEEIISKADFVITLFGVSFFESIKYGNPTVVIPLDRSENINELEMIKEKMVAIVANDAKNSVDDLQNLIQNKALSKLISDNSKKLMGDSGCHLLMNKIIKLIGN